MPLAHFSRVGGSGNRTPDLLHRREDDVLLAPVPQKGERTPTYGYPVRIQMTRPRATPLRLSLSFLFVMRWSIQLLTLPLAFVFSSAFLVGMKGIFSKAD